MSEENKSTALKAAVICLILGCLAMILSMWTIIIYGPLFLVAFVLSIVAMTQKHIGAGIAVLLGSIILPIIIFAISIALGINSINDEIQNFPETSSSETTEESEIIDYADHIEITDFKAAYYTDYLDREKAGVQLSFRNIGDMTINRVTVTVYFKDTDDQAIYERRLTPFNSAAFMSDDSPIRPGYIYEMSDNQYFEVEGVPSAWQEGNADIEVAEVDFE